MYLDNKCLFGDALDDKNFGNQKHNEELIKPKRTKSKLSEIYTINIQSLFYVMSDIFYQQILTEQHLYLNAMSKLQMVELESSLKILRKLTTILS